MGKIKKVKPKLTSQKISSSTETVKMGPQKSTSDKINFSKSLPKQLIKKKQKRNQKRNQLKNKIDLIKAQKKEEIKRKKREKTIITGDLKPLKDALPSLDELLRIKPHEIRIGAEAIVTKPIAPIPLTNNNKIKKRKKEFMDRYNCFQKLLKDADYKLNPRETIANHIKFTTNTDLNSL